MPYRYLDDIAIADAAFEAWGGTLEEMLLAAADAAINVMVGNLDAIAAVAHRHFTLEESQLDMLLFQILQELVYYKDAERLLLRVRNARVMQYPDRWTAEVDASGDFINAEIHELVTDVKAVTLHRLRVQQTSRGWYATVVLDT
ncbi:MAG TPA: archease [Acidobacteriota bacterium]|nr:archease [Acidobacteriota bacterium]